MWMTDFTKEVKRQFRDVYKMVPSGGTDDEPIFDNIPDGVYLMVIEEKAYNIKVDNLSVIVI